MTQPLPPAHETDAPQDTVNPLRRWLMGAGALMGVGALFPNVIMAPAHADTQSLPNTLDGAVKGGVLNAVVHPEPPTLAFYLNSSTPTGAVASKIFDGLVEYGPDLKPRPVLAESWSVSEDGKTLTFKLRQGVLWHDGKPFTAADVKWSAEEVWLKHAPSARRVFQYLQRIETPDDHTVVLHLSQPTPVALNAIDSLGAPILPRHLFEGTDIQNNPYNNKPVGTGPFVFKEWNRGNYIVLERNEHYWQPERPFLDRIVWKIVPDVSGRATALETGAVSYGERNPVAFTDATRLAKLPKLAVDTAGYNGFAAWLWLETNLRDPILSNLKVRQAIAHAVNKQALVKTVWNGYAEPFVSPVPSLVKPYHNPNVQQYPYDPALAEKLLDEAGYPRGAGGWRFALTHDYIPFGDDYRRTGEFVRQALRKIGIDVTLRGLDLATWTRNVFTDYNFQLISSWGTVLIDPQLGVETRYWSKAEARGTPWYNVSGYNNPEMDRVIEAAQVETDPQKRIEQYNELQRLAQRDLPLIGLFEFRWFGVWDKQLRNVTDASSHSRNNFAHVWLGKA
ncbi:ABC transporter substrate-binding protein [Achromobacter xylosoxidans]